MVTKFYRRSGTSLILKVQNVTF
uniref:Uncharacterized protein n=1 Tax=Arundo donax TaxID=35708 RepID=A0A0A9C1B4_ARUDO